MRRSDPPPPDPQADEPDDWMGESWIWEPGDLDGPARPTTNPERTPQP
jgi:hypothetical protein